MTPDDDELARIWAGVKDTARGAVRGLAAAPGEAMGALNTAANWTPTRDKYASYYSGVADKGRAYVDAMVGAPESEMMGKYGELLGPPMKTGAKALGLLGAIRPGGNPYLQATHVLSSPSELMNVKTGKPFAELSSPSYSIRDVRDFPKPPEIVPSDNPVYVAFRRGSLEPKNIPNTLFGTDMWNRTGADMARGLATPGSRLEQRFGKSTEDMRLQAGTPPTVGHTTAIELARPLNSLKHYENSPEGVGRLYKSQYPEEWELSFENDLLNWVEGQSGQHRADLRNMLMSQQLMGSSGGFGPELLNASARGDKSAQALVKSAREAPAHYAEGKVRGSLGVGNIGGMGFREFPVNTRSHDAAATNAVRNYYESLGVPTAGYKGGKGSGTRIAEMIDQLEQQAGPFGGR